MKWLMLLGGMLLLAAAIIVISIRNWIAQQTRPYEDGPVASVEWTIGGTPGIVNCVVTDSNGAPIPFVCVSMRIMLAGQSRRTDLSGRLSIPLNARTLTGVVIFADTSTDEKHLVILDRGPYFGPTVDNGINMRIAVKDVSQLTSLSNKIDTLVEESGTAFSIREVIHPDESFYDIITLDQKECEMALDYIKRHRNYRCYHLLFSLRRDWPAYYARLKADERASVLCSAMEHVCSMNDWGSAADPDLPSGIVPQALLETGTTALPYLLPLLDSKKVAHHDDSRNFRKADYAYKYACLIIGITPQYDPEPAVQDRNIDALKQRLEKLKDENK